MIFVINFGKIYIFRKKKTLKYRFPLYGLGVSSSWSQVIPFCNHALCPNYAEWVHLYRVDSNFWKCRFLVLSKVEWYQSIYDFIIVSIQAMCLQIFLGRCWAIRMLLIGSVHFWTDINWVLQIWGNLVMIAEMKKASKKYWSNSRVHHEIWGWRWKNPT